MSDTDKIDRQDWHSEFVRFMHRRPCESELMGEIRESHIKIRALLDENRELWRMLDVVHGEASKEEYLYDMNPKLKDSLSALLKRKPKDL